MKVNFISGIKDPLGLRARMQGIAQGTVTAGTTQDFDYKMTQLAYQGTNKESCFDGVQYYAKDAVVGDSVKFQIVDVDNILGYGAGFVVEEFGTSWYVAPNEMEDLRLFRSKMVPNLYIRIKYTSTGGTNVAFMCNLFQFIDTSKDA